MGKLRPIFFSTEMVQAILEGRKTQTRRTKGLLEVADWIDNFGLSVFTAPGYISGRGKHPIHGPAEKFYKMPYRPGDVIWVRESFLYVMWDHAPDLLAGARERTQLVYKASVHDDFIKYAKEKYGYKWKPSIHMPFEACRLLLRIKTVRVERLQEITQEDAIAEGVFVIEENEAYFDYLKEAGSYATPKGSFMSLWQSLNGRKSWNENPWVWVIEFERISKEEALL